MAEEWIKGHSGRSNAGSGFAAESADFEDDWDDDDGWHEDGWDGEGGWDDGDDSRENEFEDVGGDDNQFVSEDDADLEVESGCEWDGEQWEADEADEETRYLLPGLRDENEEAADWFGTGKVIGADDRTRVRKVDKFPFSAVCSLQIYRGGRDQIGTGFLVGKNLVMTAGHNLCNNPNLGSGYADKIVVYAARNGRDTYKAREVVTTQSRLKVSRAWRDSRNQLFDWGIIILKQSFGEQFGAFSLGKWSPQELKASLFNVVGYRVSNATKPRVRYQMWADVGKIIRVGKRTLRYQMETAGGQSGAPIIAWKSPRSFVVGVHNDSHSRYNRATRVTQDIAEAVEAVGGAKFF